MFCSVSSATSSGGSTELDPRLQRKVALRMAPGLQTHTDRHCLKIDKKSMINSAAEMRTKVIGGSPVCILQD